MRVILTFILALTCLLSQGQNFTNKGREFWVGYGHSDLFATNQQDMVVYLSAEQPARVTVSIPGTGWVKNYTIAGNSVVVSDIIPKTGAEDCRLTNEGLFRKAVHIESDVPIVAYAHMYGQKSSGAAMLLPVETYAYTYSSVNASQDYAADCYSWFYIIASEDNTRVRITPSVRTKGDKSARTAFDVNLKKGEIYNVMGYNPGSSVGYDLSGSKALSIPGADGKCHPITMFSGSSRTYICSAIWGVSGGDYLMQQVFPVTAWGARYLAGLTSTYNDPLTTNPNRFRVYVSDPNTQVYANGTPLTGIVNFTYYDFSATTSQYITADKPIMVAQLLPSQGACNTTGYGDPEIIFLSPMEQAIKNVAFYTTNKEAIVSNFVTLTIHENGLPSLTIDNSQAYSVYDHPGLPGYKVVVQQMANTPAQHNIKSDSGFNAITYGLGEHESYGYNAGCFINNLTYLAELKNDLSATPNTYTCPNTPFSINVKTLYPLTGIAWHYGEVPGFTPNGNIIYTSPVLAGTEIVNGKTYNVYHQPIPATAPAVGTYYIPVTIQSPNIDNCSNTEKFIMELVVKAGPTADFTGTVVCATDKSVFVGSSTETAVDTWVWDFGDKTAGTGKTVERPYEAGGSYDVTLLAGRSVDGCAVPVTKTFNVPYMPAAAFDIPAVVCMPGGEVKLVNKTTMPGTNPSSIQYQWDFGDGNTSTAQNPTHYYASSGAYPVKLTATAAGCNNAITATVSTFADKPKASFDVSDPAVCAGKQFVFTDRSTLTGNPSAAIFKWTFGDGTTGSGATPSKLYKQAGSYPVSMFVVSSDGCNSDTATTQVTVYPIPVVNAGPDVITEPARAVQLKATVTPVTANVLWTPPTGLSDPRQLQPMATLQENQSYVITATGEYGCAATDTVLVKVFKELKIPNAFTPNGDGKNDTWRIPGLEEYRNAAVQVFNRWGQVVFKSVGYSIPWNGLMNGNKLPTGAYYYVIKPGDNGYGVLSGMVMIVN